MTDNPMPIATLVEELVLSVFHAVRMTYKREGRNLGGGPSLDEKMYEGARRAIASLGVRPSRHEYEILEMADQPRPEEHDT
jgi:hypothetical protein